MTDFDVDFFVIGAGSGGVRAARIAAGHGARVAIAEDFRIGGTCVIRGCVPKKLMVYAGRFAHDFEDAAGYGWTLPAPPTFDWAKLIAAKDAEIARLSGLYRANLEKAGVAIHSTRARLGGPNEVRLAGDERPVRAARILIATGGAPHPLNIPGGELAITSNEIFDLPRLPRRILIVGGGFVAVEFASLLANLGSEVTLAMRGDNVLRGFDEDLRASLRETLREAGIGLRFGETPQRLETRGEGLVAHLPRGPLHVDHVMMATGRAPATGDLGLGEAGVATRENGAIVVDAWSRSSVASVFAVGDVTDRVNLTPVAIREGHALADDLFGGRRVAVDHSLVPSAVFTTPEIGTVGLTEARARERHGAIDVYRARFRPMKATLSGRREHTMMKLLVEPGSDRVLGCHIFGHEAGEMIQLVGVAMTGGATKAQFDATMAVHPTAAEELVTMRAKVAE